MTPAEQLDHQPAAPVWRTGLAVLLLALLIRAFLCSQLACISRDGVHFVTFAKQLAGDPIGAMKATTKQPGFAWLLLGTHRLTGFLLGGDTPLGWQRCGQMLALLAGVAVCGLVYAITRRLFDATVAAVAGILAAFWWQGAQLSVDVLSDMPHLALYLTAWLLAYRVLLSGVQGRGALAYIALCGIVAGLAYLLRQEALGLVAAIAVWLVWPRLGMPRRRRLLAVLVLGICFVAVVAPHAVAVGQIMPNKGLHDLLFGWPRVSQAGGWPPSPVLARVIPMDGIWWESPLAMLGSWARSGRYVISVLVLVGLAWRHAPVSERAGRGLVVIAIIMHLVLVQLRVNTYGEISSRYLIVPAALTIPWAASGLVALLNTAINRLRSSGNAARFLILMVGIIVPLMPQAYYWLRPAAYAEQYLRTAGEWLARDVKPDAVVLADQRLEQLMFYASRTYPHDAAWLRIPKSATGDEIAELLERSPATWFLDAEAYRPLPAGGAATANAATTPFEDGSFLLSLERRGQVELTPKWLIGPSGKRVCLMRASR